VGEKFAIRYDVTGEDAVEHQMLAIGDRAMDTKALFDNIANFLRARMKDLYAKEGRGQWPALKEATVEEKKRLGFPLDILHRELFLRDSLTKKGGGGFAITTNESLFFGTSVDYAHFHKTGTEHMPKRDPMIIERKDKRDIQKMIQQHLMAEERAAFGLPGFGTGLTTPFGI
jgi:phage gpG-like protein